LDIYYSISQPASSRSLGHLHFPPKKFHEWLLSQQSHILFFDGTSKGNPGLEGARGVLLGPRRIIESRYAWSIGYATNNQEEEYVLLKGVQLEIE
jgi:hypothetical protein